jgi:hypothetical protein
LCSPHPHPQNFVLMKTWPTIFFSTSIAVKTWESFVTNFYRFRDTSFDELLSPGGLGLGSLHHTPSLSGGLGLGSSHHTPSLYDTMKHGNSAAYLENMESQLKMRDGNGIIDNDM